MPYAAPSTCDAGDCATLATIGRRCPEHSAPNPVATRRQWRNAASGGSGGAWQRIRSLILMRDGYRCQVCWIDLRALPSRARQVDHIIPVEDGGMADPANLRSTCARCNQARKRTHFA